MYKKNMFFDYKDKLIGLKLQEMLNNQNSDNPFVSIASLDTDSEIENEDEESL